MPSAMAVQNTQANILSQYGWLLARKGQYEKAAALLDFRRYYALLSDTISVGTGEMASWQRDEARRLWREITLLEPTHVWENIPEGLAEDLEKVPRYSADGIWFTMPTVPSEGFSGLGKATCYFFVVAGPDGVVETARPLDREDPIAYKLIPAVQEIIFSRRQAEGLTQGSVHIVKIARQENGTVAAFRSAAGAVSWLAENLAFEEFPRIPAPPAEVR